MSNLKRLDQLKSNLDKEYTRFSNMIKTIGIVHVDYLETLKAAEDFSSLLRRSDYARLSDDPEAFRKEKWKIIADANQLSYQYNDEDDIVFSFPRLPKKKFGLMVANKEYMFTLANTLFASVAKKYNLTKRMNPIVVFEFEYRNDEGHKELLDYDNVDVSTIINALTNYFLIDDSPDCYSLFYTSKDVTNEMENSSQEKTNVYLLSKEKFLTKPWLAG